MPIKSDDKHRDALTRALKDTDSIAGVFVALMHDRPSEGADGACIIATQLDALPNGPRLVVGSAMLVRALRAAADDLEGALVRVFGVRALDLILDLTEIAETLSQDPAPFSARPVPPKRTRPS